ncbi:MAG: ATP-binding protein [Planctomycetes bacterium]|nr:ATP-binding protein [Planctomycetota bacterium]
MNDDSSRASAIGGPPAHRDRLPAETGATPAANGPRTGLGTGTRPGGALPDWCPSWAERLGDAYLSGTSCVFLAHGNVRDLVPLGPESATTTPAADPAAAFGTVGDFLAREVFGSWDVVLAYDVGKGLRPLAGSDPSRLRTMVQWLSERLGNASAWPREPDAALAAIDAILERNLTDPPEQRKKIAVFLDHAQYLVPDGDAASASRGTAGRLVRVVGWATNPLLRRVNVAIVLLAETMAEVHPRLVTNPAVTAIEVPLPDADERRRFALATARAVGVPVGQMDAVERMSKLSAGLTLESIRAIVTLSAREGTAPDGAEFGAKKKDLIERSCRGLIEFIQPRLTLDNVAGHEAAKARLEADAKAIRRGQLDAAPMGYLICGPVGTGKSFIAECYAGSVGIPCVELKNFRSKYVGETEGNLEHALGVLRSLGPVVVIIDEADAALGNRESGGDSGTSARVFSMIARQMGDTRYRGKIVWMLLTSRPDRLPIDLKRQGRAEVHIPLFYPHDQAEMEAMFQAMARKCRVKLAPGLPGQVDLELGLSGADIESIVLAARRKGLERAAAAAEEGRPAPGGDEIGDADFQEALTDFLPSAQGLEKEAQEIAAVLECTEKRFLPERWREAVSRPGGRADLQERMAELRDMAGT